MPRTSTTAVLATAVDTELMSTLRIDSGVRAAVVATGRLLLHGLHEWNKLFDWCGGGPLVKGRKPGWNVVKRFVEAWEG